MNINTAEATKRLQQLPGWQLQGNCLTQEFVFKDFTQAFSFMTAAAKAAERLNHHPDWSNSYNKIQVRLTSHSAAALTEKDFELAAIMNTISEGLEVV
jgi:4a-hydroxytetrahydrobiopterin dehydratase